MWFNLNDKDLRQIEMLLPELGQRLRSEQASNSEPARQDYRDAVPTSDGDLEVDSEAIVSIGDDPGAYVMCWKWVDDAAAGVTRPESDAFKKGKADYAGGTPMHLNPFATTAHPTSSWIGSRWMAHGQGKAAEKEAA